MAVDSSPWDGGRAMAECSTAADYNRVCAGTKAGDPALRSSHALPHHYLSKAPTPNADGVTAALRMFGRTQGLTNSGAARAHLEAHMTSIQASRSVDAETFPVPSTKAGLLTHLQNPDHALQGSGLEGESLLELQQLHLGLHRKETPDHLHPDLDLDANADIVSPPEIASAASDDEFRAISPLLAATQVRDLGDGGHTLYGHFAVFDRWARIDSVSEGTFMERIRPGAFTESFAERTPKIMFQHGRDPQVGEKVIAAPATVTEDDIGARYEAPLLRGVPELLVEGIRAGEYGASFRFHVDEQEVVRKPGKASHNPEGLPERSVIRALVSEGGPVTWGAYAEATSGIRSLTDEFRVHTFQHQLKVMVREHPKDLAATIHRMMPVSEDKPLEDKPPAIPKFRSREDWLEWVTRS